MHRITADAIEKRLRGMGLSAASSRNLAQFVMDEFNIAGAPESPSDGLLCNLVDALASATAQFRATVQGHFGVRPLTEAPARWKNRADRLPDETPLEFIERVWGRHMRAGQIYQCDIARLGDPELCPAIRSYCQRMGLIARDYLPPGKRVKIDRLYLASAPGTSEAQELQNIVHIRLFTRRAAMARRAAPS